MSYFKLVLLIKQHAALATATFQQAWLSARQAQPIAIGLKHHVFNQILIDDKMHIKTDAQLDLAGIEELWFDSQAAADAYIQHLQQQLHADNALSACIAPEQLIAMGGHCHIIIQSTGRDPAERIKILLLGMRREGMSQTEYCDYWINHHGKLVSAAPSAQQRHYRVEYCPIEKISDIRHDQPLFDGIATIQFHSAADQLASLEDQYYAQVLAKDEPNFSNSAQTYGTRVKEILISSAATH